jgi:hypothetical protein
MLQAIVNWLEKEPLTSLGQDPTPTTASPILTKTLGLRVTETTTTNRTTPPSTTLHLRQRTTPPPTTLHLRERTTPPSTTLHLWLAVGITAPTIHWSTSERRRKFPSLQERP